MHMDVCTHTYTHTHTHTHTPSLSMIIMMARVSPRLTSFGSTLSKLAKNSSVPSAIVSLIIGTGTCMTSSPPAEKVKVREIPVKSPAIEKEVFESGREEDEME